MSQNYIPQIVIQTKPYITVSAKGISNGLSNTFNDGADFGPDTLLNATSPSQYGPPYTQTVGLQEAINYVSMLGGGVVFVLRGRYIQSTPITTVYVPSNVIVRGEGIDITVIGMSVLLGSQSQSSPPLTQNAWLMDLTIDGTSFASNQSGIGYNYVKDSGLIRVKVFNVPFWSIIGLFYSGVPTSPSLYLIDCIWDRNLNTAGGGQDMSAFNYNDKIYIVNNVWKNNSEGSTILTYLNVNTVFIRGLEMRNVGSAYRGLNLAAAVYSLVKDVFSDSGSHQVGNGTVGQSAVIMNISGYSCGWAINTQYAHISGVKRLNYNGQTGFYFALTPVAGSSSSTIRNNYSVTDVDVDQVLLSPQSYSTWYLFMRSARFHPDPAAQSPPPGAAWGQFLVYNPGTLTNSQIYFNAEVSAGTLNLNYNGPTTTVTGLTLSGYLKAKLRVGSVGVPVNGSIYLNNALSNLRIEVEGLDIQPSIPQNLATFTSSYIKIKYGGTSSIYPLPATPAVPASGTANTVTNNNPYPVVVMINGAVTGVYITPSGGTQTQVFGSVSNATLRLNPGDAIALTYSTAPIWTWLPA